MAWLGVLDHGRIRVLVEQRFIIRKAPAGPRGFREVEMFRIANTVLHDGHGTCLNNGATDLGLWSSLSSFGLGLDACCGPVLVKPMWLLLTMAMTQN